MSKKKFLLTDPTLKGGNTGLPKRSSPEYQTQMPRRFQRALLILSLMVLGGGTFISCSNEDEAEIPKGNVAGIPSDDLASANPTITSSNTVIPNVAYTLEKVEDATIVKLDMTGIQIPSQTKGLKAIGTVESKWLKLYGTGHGNQNIWIELDGVPKGILVENNSDKDINQKIKTDVVFLVDNSGSMGEEANAVARDIMEWSQKLANSNLDVQFGCVGYNDYGSISGAINLTSEEDLSTYLNRSYGTNRTKGFEGTDAAQLANKASSLGYTRGENGVMALRFADENFQFRTGSNRIYVNFTDEPNQPDGKSAWSVEYVKDQLQWPSYKGTVHTVYSGYDFNENPNYAEYPWKLSEYTGGTVIRTNASFTGVTLDNLPVTGAMENSYVIKLTNIHIDGKSHILKITVYDKEKNVMAEKNVSITFSSMQQ